MRLHIIARGKIGRSPESELVERYAKRITWPFKLTELPETGGNVPEPLIKQNFACRAEQIGRAHV